MKKKCMAADAQIVKTMEDFYKHQKAKEMLKAHEGHDVQLATGMTTDYCAMICETCGGEIVVSTDDLKEVK
jgi:uncharacterized protein YutE (UPF0331/DUF86 family)